MSASSSQTKVRDLRPNLPAVSVKVIVLEAEPPQKAKDGSTIFNVLVADDSAAITMAVLSQVGELLRAGDVLGVEGAATALTQEGMTLTLSRSSVVKRLGRFNMLFNESVNMSHMRWVPNPADLKSMIPDPAGAAAAAGGSAARPRAPQ